MTNNKYPFCKTRTKSRLVVLSSVCALLVGQAGVVGSAHATGLVAGATEFTQIFNNLELAYMNVQEATQVAESINTQINTAKTTVHGIKNLRTLTPQILAQTLAPYDTQLGQLQGMLKAVNNVRSASEKARAMVQRRSTDASAAHMPMRKYLDMETKLAKVRGDIYRAQMDDDIQTIDNLHARAAQLKALTAATPGIEGNIQGLQLLNQHASMQAGELMEIKAAVLKANIDKADEKAATEDSNAVKADAMSATIDAAKSRSARNKAAVMPTTDIYKTWPGMEAR